MARLVEKQSVKVIARVVLEQLPDDATWDDLIHAMEVLRSVEAGLRDIEEGRTVPHSEVLRRLGLDS